MDFTPALSPAFIPQATANRQIMLEMLYHRRVCALDNARFSITKAWHLTMLAWIVFCEWSVQCRTQASLPMRFFSWIAGGALADVWIALTGQRAEADYDRSEQTLWREIGEIIDIRSPLLQSLSLINIPLSIAT